ncbi:MAG TPA: transposase, partial [Gemmataceae bacterium]|jgi:REP element-mobilizing transposase RayT
MARTWLLTSTTYGTWLPGDERGFVSRVKDGPGPRITHNVPETPVDKDIAGLRASARELLKCPPILLSQEQAIVVLDQFRETAAFRHWLLLAGAVMANHFHLVVSAGEDVPSTDLLRDFKSYASRALNRKWPKPASGTWWTESGSRRSLPDDRAMEAAIEYVRRQQSPLALWITSDSRLSGGRQPPRVW